MTENNEATVIDRELDIRGEVCPFTFVKSKLALEMMDQGEVLRIVVDYEPAIENVPRSFMAEGHDVLQVVPLVDGEWAIVVRKS